MLKKLLKYDLKYLYKPLIIFYLLSFFFAIIGRLFVSIDNSFIFNIIGQICLITANVMMINALINNIIRAFIRFIRNIYGDESYLTHTLPVEKKTIYLSKFLSAIITMFTTIILIIVCLFICYYSKETMEFIKNSLESMATIYNSTVINFILIMFLTFFVEMLVLLMIGYIAIILGNKSNNNKIIKSVIYGFIIFLITQLVVLLTIFIIALFNSNIMNLFTSSSIITDLSYIKIIMLVAIIAYTFIVIIYYFIGKKLLNKGVDVD